MIRKAIEQESKTRTGTSLTCIGADMLYICDRFMFGYEGEAMPLETNKRTFES